MEPTSRFFLCARCRTQVFICSRCDRGQLYCSNHCSQAARCHTVRTAGSRYQLSRQGRFNHAERARRYRRRQHKVTHQGSVPATSNDVLKANPAKVASQVIAPNVTKAEPLQCHFCGTVCSGFVRHRFLQRRRVPGIVQPDRRGTPHDYSP
jgi:hypothetical protein